MLEYLDRVNDMHLASGTSVKPPRASFSSFGHHTADPAQTGFSQDLSVLPAFFSPMSQQHGTNSKASRVTTSAVFDFRSSHLQRPPLQALGAEPVSARSFVHVNAIHLPPLPENDEVELGQTVELVGFRRKV